MEQVIEPEGLGKEIHLQSIGEKSIKKNNVRTLSFAFFLFVNPTSGGNQAGELTNLNAEQIRFQLEPDLKIFGDQGNGAHLKNGLSSLTQVDVFIYNLKDEENKKKGFECLRQVQQQRQTNVRVVAGGGDGTVVWVIEEMVKFGCDFEQTPIGIIAYGTGNDFSRVTGWGGGDPGSLTAGNLKGLKNMIKRWLNALIEDFDIWDIKISTYEKDGAFKKICVGQNKQVQKVIMKDHQDQQLYVMKKKMCNYFSIGVESRIGLGFDRKRTTSPFLNKVVYCWEGFKKMFMKTQPMHIVIESLEKFDKNEKNNLKVQEINLSFEKQPPENNKKTTIFKTKTDTPETLTWKDKPASLVVLNINSMMGGVMNIWESAKNNSGLAKKNEPDTLNLNNKFEKTSFGDGKIEILSFENISKIATEKFIKGQAKRIEQGTGPYVINFNQTDEQGQNVITYFQVDGEYYQILGPKQVTIQPTKSIPRGKIKVMIESSSRATNLKN